MNIRNIGLVAGALIIILGVGTVLFAGKGSDQNNTSPTPSVAVTQPTSAKETKFMDGEYQQAGDYSSPAGPEAIDISLTLKDGVITEVTATPKAEHPKSKYFQGIFVENYRPMVVGKNLKDLKLDKVAGSSLTPQGFNDALDKIKIRAQS